MSSTAIPLNLDINEQFARALHLMENTDSNVFVTGKAGTGKSTLLSFFRQTTRKKIVVLAPTGVAAVNVRGQTIHSFFTFKPDITPSTAATIKPRSKKIYRALDAIVIDEISMVRADLLDCIDIFLRRFGRNKKQPFGGIQMILIGDLYQLPPVVTHRERQLFGSLYASPYFFDAKVIAGDSGTDEGGSEKKPGRKLLTTPFPMVFVELEKVYRQRDERFIHLLNAIRNNSVTEDELTELNARCLPSFVERDGDFYVHLTSTNELADAINHEKLDALAGRELRYQGLVEGSFHAKELPTHELLRFKVGAQVMLLNNHPEGFWINGSIGRVVDIERDGAGRDVVAVELAGGDTVYVTPFTWEMFRFSYDDETKGILSESVGSFSQYPLKLAWAVTIHKSQGKSFDRVVIDIGRGTFSHGQMYVALSRCTTFEGIVLRKPVEKRHIMMDWRVVNFVTRYQYGQAERTCSTADRLRLLQEAARQKQSVEIVYLKTGDDKSRRIVLPLYAGEMEYNGRTYLGLRAFCENRKAERTFRIDRILEISIKD